MAVISQNRSSLSLLLIGLLLMLCLQNIASQPQPPSSGADGSAGSPNSPPAAAPPASPPAAPPAAPGASPAAAAPAGAAPAAAAPSAPSAPGPAFPYKIDNTTTQPCNPGSPKWDDLPNTGGNGQAVIPGVNTTSVCKDKCLEATSTCKGIIFQKANSECWFLSPEFPIYMSIGDSRTDLSILHRAC